MSDKVLSQFKQEAVEEKKAAGKKFKIGIIGTGWIAESHIQSYKNQPDVEIVAAADLIPGKAEKFLKEYEVEAPTFEDYKKMIDTIVFVPEVGMLYYGKVVRILNFGAFVELAPGKDGMVHISKLAERRVEKVEDVVHVGDMVWVKVTDIDEKGRVNLSLRDAQREIAAMEARDAKKHNN